MTRPVGFVEWFRPGDVAHAEAVIRELRNAGVGPLRTQLSWAEWHEPGGPDWYDWLLPRLGPFFDLTLCAAYTPPSRSRTGRSSGPPRRPRDYADWLDVMLTRHGAHIGTVELWNEPNNLLDWDWRADPDHAVFAEMVGAAGHWAGERGFRTVLGAPCPFDAMFLEQMGRAGVLGVVSAIGLHGFPGTWDSAAAGWPGWAGLVAEARAIVDRWQPGLEVWITEAGYSTWRHDEAEQVRRFVEFREAPADRLFWYSWRDISPDIAVQKGHWTDPRHYHTGAVDSAGRPKAVRQPRRRRARPGRGAGGAGGRRQASRPVVITGGSGFIGANLADAFLADGDEVVVLDNLSRHGVEEYLAGLIAAYGHRVHPAIVDIRDPRALATSVDGARAVFHFAVQTAVTTSLADPEVDFEINARGTFNLLRAVRAGAPDAPVIFASTNKVYGDLADIEMERFPDRILPRDAGIRPRGLAEDRPLHFCTPYGCSKGAADSYALDAAASFGLRTAVLRMSCIYGPRQFGTEDQGWVAHFLLRALAGEEITIFGDGRQVRDILDVTDAVAAYRAVLARIGTLSGQAFNLGGGPANAVSLLALIDEIGRGTGRKPRVRHVAARQGDQPYFVADTACIEAATGWRARVGWRDVTGTAHLEDDEPVTVRPLAVSPFAGYPALAWPDAWIARHAHHHHRFDTPQHGHGAEVEVEASRGCPYACSFCAKLDFRDGYRRRNLANLLAEIDGMIRPLDITVFSLTLSSSWGNGHATTYRSLTRGLAAQGHHVTFFERDMPWYAENRDLARPEFCRLILYDDMAATLDAHADTIAAADAVIVGSYVPDGVALIDGLAALAPAQLCFYDIDTPVTLARLARGDEEYLARRQIPLFDACFSFSGGDVLTRLETEFGARRVEALHCAVDPGRYAPTGDAPRWDLGYLGTWSADRQPMLERLLIEPARRLPTRRFVVAGPQYPDDIAWPPNVERIEHLPPADHAAFYSRQRFTLNVTRADMRRAGWSPSVRIFEAAACGTPIISDSWPGLDDLLPIGRAILTACSTDEVVAALATGEERRRTLAATARRIVLARHTSEIRAAELASVLAEPARTSASGCSERERRTM